MIYLSKLNNIQYSSFKANKKIKNKTYINHITNTKTKNDKIITSSIVTTGLTTILAALLKKQTDYITSLKKEMSKYPEDINYRKSILNYLSLPDEDYYKLRSIIGKDEFNDVINDLSNDRENFLPGKTSYKKK